MPVYVVVDHADARRWRYACVFLMYKELLLRSVIYFFIVMPILLVSTYNVLRVELNENRFSVFASDNA